MLVCECVVLLLFCDLLTDLCMLIWGAISGSTGGLWVGLYGLVRFGWFWWFVGLLAVLGDLLGCWWWVWVLFG